MNSVAAGLQPKSSTGIIIRMLFNVLTPIDFDYEATFQTHEINNKWPDNVLTPELVTIELPSAQATPKDSLRIG